MNPELPSRELLRRLPRRAIVAYAARCARRVQPIFLAMRGEMNDSDRRVASVERAILLAEEFCRGRALADDSTADADADAYTPARAAAYTAEYAAAIRAAAAAAYAARTARTARTARAAYAAADAADAADAARAAYVAYVEVGTRNATTNAAANAATAAVNAARQDYEHLCSLNLGTFPELGETIDPSESGPLGPLWPDSASPNIALPADSDSAKGIEIYIDPGNASVETIREVLESLSDLHLATGGLGLEFKADDLRIFNGAEVVQ